MKKPYVKRGKDNKTIRKMMKGVRFAKLYEVYEKLTMNGKIFKSVSQLTVFLYIYRNTFTWNDLSFYFDINDAVERTEIHRITIYKALDKLEKMGLIAKKKNKYGMVITINGPDKWQFEHKIKNDFINEEQPSVDEQESVEEPIKNESKVEELDYHLEQESVEQPIKNKSVELPSYLDTDLMPLPTDKDYKDETKWLLNNL